jgi:hypothetical protein
MDAAEIQRLDAALSEWRQGDVALEETWFVHVADPGHALTLESSQTEGELQAITCEVEGLIVVTQTCDIVRSCETRPFVEASPLVLIADPNHLKEIERGLRPRYASIPTLADRFLVADLDRTMTIEKGVLASWRRTPGWTNDNELRLFAEALTRKLTRFAFPDEFTSLVKNLQGRIRGKHDKNSEEGQFLRTLREIRVNAVPSWAAEQVKVFFWFICDEPSLDKLALKWDKLLKKWLELVPDSKRFTHIDGQIAALEDLTAKDYVESDRLDLDYLSGHQ